MAELYIGTSGYDYPEWQGENLFYPQTLKRADYLSYYAAQFNSLELNGTYYRMPSPEQMKRMAARTNGKVTFSVKAYQGLTHAQDKSNYQPLISEFKKAIEPLQKANVLLCTLLQFPQSFHYEKDQRLYLDSLLKEMSDSNVIVEMRNKGWQNGRVYNELQQRNIGWCITDNPSLKSLPELNYLVTNRIAYMRFHGRNAAMWYTGDNTSRYDYHYSDMELQSFVKPIKQLFLQAERVQLFFNNHAEAKAVKNARKLALMLKE